MLRKIWTKSVFCGDQTTDFTIIKVNFQVNTLVYANQCSVTPVKERLAIYLDYIILGQLIPAINTTDNMDEYGCKPNEVKLITALYNVDSGKFLVP